MKRLKSVSKIIALALFLGATFEVGRFYTPAKTAPLQPVRKVLYWVDPMHPAYKSDKPGIAPDCGMKLEPVYEEPASAAPSAAAAPPGTIQISPENSR